MTIRSYRVCFSVERRIHKLDRWRVPLPYGLPVRGLVYFACAALAVLVLSPFPVVGDLLGDLHPIMRFLLVPGAVAMTLYRLALDGRPAHAAGLAWVRMRLEPSRMAAFRAVEPPGPVTLGTLVMAPDERFARMRAGVIEGPADVLIRYPAQARQRRTALHVRQQDGEVMPRGKQIRLGAGQRVVVS